MLVLQELQQWKHQANLMKKFTQYFILVKCDDVLDFYLDVQHVLPVAVDFVGGMNDSLSTISTGKGKGFMPVNFMVVQINLYLCMHQSAITL